MTGRVDRGVGPSGQDTGRVGDDTVRSRRITAIARPTNQATSRTAPRATRRESPSAADPVADRMSAATIAAPNNARVAIVAIEATTGTTSSTASTATWRI